MTAETKREKKDRLRATMHILTPLATEVDDCMTRRQPLSTVAYNKLVAISGSHNLDSQLTALEEIKEKTEEDLIAIWVELARDNYHDFYEFMNRNEGEDEQGYTMSPHQRLIGDLLMESFRKETMRFMLSLPPGHTKPVAITEPVTLGNGRRVPLGAVVVGDEVITHEHRARRVTGVHVQGVLPEWEVVTDQGRCITTAGDHPYLTPRGWVDASALVTTDSLAVVPFDLPDHPSRTDDDFSLAGYLIGDGSVTANNCAFTNADPAIWVEFKAIVARMGFTLGVNYKKHSKAATHRINDGGKAWVKAAGFDGCNSYTKRVPDWVFEGSNRQIALFVGAYWACDGTVHKKGRSERITSAGTARRDLGIELTSVSGSLVEDVRSLLGRLGIRSMVRERTGRYKGVEFPHFRLRVGPERACAAFKEAVRIPGEKQARLDAWEPALDWLPRYLADRVVSVQPTGRNVEMRCLTVEDDHSFLVQDVAVHNSTHSSHHFPAFWFGHNPRRIFLQAGHGQQFVANELGAKVKAIVSSDDYQRVFPIIKIANDMRAKDYWALTNRKGKYIGRGAGQGISGFRGHYGMVDDPYASRKDAESPVVRADVFKWYSDDFSTRLLPGSPLGIIQTRWHSDDICGRIADRQSREDREEIEKAERNFIENMEATEGNTSKYRFKIINLPAISEDADDPLGRAIGEPLWPEVYSIAALENLRADMTPASWNSLYQGTPMDISGGTVTQEWFRRYDELPAKPNAETQTPGRIRRVAVTVDAANTAKERSDFSVIQVWIEDLDRKHYLADVWRKQVEFTQLITEIDLICARWEKIAGRIDALLVEAKGNGLAYCQLKEKGGAPAPLIPIEVGTASKEFRFDEVSPMFEAGLIHLPNKASWLPDFEKELVAFPNGKHDDQVDACSQYLKWARQKGKRGNKKLRGMGNK